VLNAGACLGSGLVLQSCVLIYPVHKTIQHEQSFLVIDEKGMPVEGAMVTYISNSNPHHVEQSRVSQQTDKGGRVQFPRIREWQTEATIIHGWLEYYWTWCVTAPGYETAQTIEGHSVKGAEIVVDLKPGQTKACYKSWTDGLIRSDPRK